MDRQTTLHLFWIFVSVLWIAYCIKNLVKPKNSDSLTEEHIKRHKKENIFLLVLWSVCLVLNLFLLIFGDRPLS